MSSTQAAIVRNGSCLCSAIQFKAKLDSLDVGICHCHLCQKISGGVFMSVAVSTAVELLSEKDFSVYESSPWGERLFCNSCGSTIAWRMQDKTMAYYSAASFDDQTGFTLKSEIYYDEKPNFYELANETHKMTSKEVEALYSSKES